MAIDTTRRAPRISVNKLGEYMTATPLRRRRIVQDQKRPKGFILPRYTEAQDAITKYLVGGKQDEGRLHSEIERLNIAPSATEWESDRKRLACEALQSFLEIADAIDLDGLSATPGGNDQPRLSIGGLDVSVRPEVLLSGTDRHARPTVGAIKLYFSKTNPLTEESATYIATAVHAFVNAHMPSAHAEAGNCRVIDVFGQRVYTAPRALRAATQRSGGRMRGDCPCLGPGVSRFTLPDFLVPGAGPVRRCLPLAVRGAAWQAPAAPRASEQRPTR